MIFFKYLLYLLIALSGSVIKCWYPFEILILLSFSERVKRKLGSIRDETMNFKTYKSNFSLKSRSYFIARWNNFQFWVYVFKVQTSPLAYVQQSVWYFWCSNKKLTRCFYKIFKVQQEFSLRSLIKLNTAFSLWREKSHSNARINLIPKCALARHLVSYWVIYFAKNLLAKFTQINFIMTRFSHSFFLFLPQSKCWAWLFWLQLLEKRIQRFKVHR